MRRGVVMDLADDATLAARWICKVSFRRRGCPIRYGPTLGVVIDSDGYCSIKSCACDIYANDWCCKWRKAAFLAKEGASFRAFQGSATMPGRIHRVKAGRDD